MIRTCSMLLVVCTRCLPGCPACLLRMALRCAVLTSACVRALRCVALRVVCVCVCLAPIVECRVHRQILTWTLVRFFFFFEWMFVAVASNVYTSFAREYAPTTMQCGNDDAQRLTARMLPQHHSSSSSSPSTPSSPEHTVTHSLICIYLLPANTPPGTKLAARLAKHIIDLCSPECTTHTTQTCTNTHTHSSATGMICSANCARGKQISQVCVLSARQRYFSDRIGPAANRNRLVGFAFSQSGIRRSFGPSVIRISVDG